MNSRSVIILSVVLLCILAIIAAYNAGKVRGSRDAAHVTFTPPAPMPTDRAGFCAVIIDHAGDVLEAEAREADGARIEAQHPRY